MQKSNRSQIVVIAIMVVMVILGVGFGWYPINSDTKELRAEINQTQQKLLGSESKTEDLKALALNVQFIRREINTTNKVIPRQDELAALVRAMGKELADLGLGDQSISTQSSKRGNEYVTLPIEVGFTGDAEAGFRFVRNIEEMPRLVQLQKLVFRSSRKNPSQVETKLNMNTFFYATQE